MDIIRENQIIASIYDAALNQSLWSEVIKEIVDYTKSKAAIFTALDQLNPDANFVYSHNIPVSGLAAYQDEQVRLIDMKLHMPLFERLALGDVLQQNMYHYHAMPNTDEYIFYEKCLKPTGVAYLAGVLLDRGEFRWAILGIHRSPDAKPFERVHLDFLKRISIHLRRALQIHKRMALLEYEKNNAFQVLNHIKTGIILLDYDCVLQYANEKARQIFNQTQLITIDAYQRIKLNSALQARFNALCETAKFTASCKNHAQVADVLVIEGEQQHYMISIVPLRQMPDFYHVDLPKKKYLTVFIAEKKQTYSLAYAYLKQAFHLTKREIELCEYFVNGQSFEEIATHTTLSLSSIRTYFKNIYAKLNCTSQAQLLHVLTGLTLNYDYVQ